ncbi:MAG: glutamine amidotransferase class-I [Akkermansiaceae bacterium]|nr:glutamine amidotransferase class-I [Akkermansiaceae bacterium]
MLRHVGFEDLGLLAAPLEETGHVIRYWDVWTEDLAAFDPLGPDLLVVLGGPIGVYESDRYPFLAKEIEILRQRLAREMPTLGICLGAQLIATTLGAEVFPSGIKEIGWAPLALTEAGSRSPLRHLEGLPVLHWHGDTLDLPPGSRHLAMTDACAQQAFSVGHHVLGLQFHAEVDAVKGIESWLIGHACEIAGAGLDPRDLRHQTAEVGRGGMARYRAFFTEWLNQLSTGKSEEGNSQRDEAAPGVLLDGPANFAG